MNDIFDKAEDGVDADHEVANEKMSLSARVAVLERDIRGHSRIISAVMATLRSQGKTIEEIEEWQLRVMLDEVRREEQNKALLLSLSQIKESFDTGLGAVEKRVTSLGSTWTRILWIAATPVIGAVVIAVLSLAFGGVPKP